METGGKALVICGAIICMVLVGNIFLMVLVWAVAAALMKMDFSTSAPSEEEENRPML